MKAKNIRYWTDEALVEAYQKTDDNQYFGELYQRYYPKVVNTCIGKIKDHDSSNDLAQEILLKVMVHLPKLQHKNLLGLWIHRITINHCNDYLKSRKCQPIGWGEDSFDIPDDVSDVDSLILKEKIYENLKLIIEQLDDDDRAIIKLKYFDNYSVKELQDKFTLSESAVKMRLSRARKRMVSKYPVQQISALFA